MNRLALAVLLLLLVPANAVIYRAILARPAIALEELRVGKEGEERAVLVRTAGGHAILVNAGPDAGILRVLGEALPPWQRTLDALVLTDMGGEHAGGAPFVLARYRPGAFIRPAASGSPAREAAVAAALAAGGAEMTRVPPRAGLVLHYASQSVVLP